MKLKISSEDSKSWQTVLEGKPYHPSHDDFELWDQNQMLRAEADHDTYNWRNGRWCKPSYIPISIILTLIVLVVLLPLVEHSNEKHLHAKRKEANFVCADMCRIQLVESIPDGLNFSDNSPRFMSTYEAWSILLDKANKSIDIGSFYWSLRASDIYNHSSAWQGEKIFQQLLSNGQQNKYHIRIAQSNPTKNQPSKDTEILAKRKAAEVRSVNFPRLIGGGVLHTKLWIADGQHFYLGSANMDWRSLTQVKEMGVLVTNCSCLSKDLLKIFETYWFLGQNNSQIPLEWPTDYATRYNMSFPINVAFNENKQLKTFFSNSPPPLNPAGRTNDIDAIVHTILHAEKFVHIAVMDYFPLLIYTPKTRYWPYIDDAIRTAAIENKVSVKMLISWWNHSQPSEDHFLQSLHALSFNGVDIQIRRFIVPADDDQRKIPFARVNHNKYMVTDSTAYIGTSNWSGDYFTDTAGIGLVIRDPDYERSENETTIVSELASVFERDWNSPYALELLKN